MLKIETTIKGKKVKLSGRKVEDVCKKASHIAGFTIKPERVITQGIWSLAYKPQLLKKLRKHAKKE